jgi:hypothetical protein
MSVGVETGRKNWTEADLQSLPEEGYIHEVVNGKLVMSPKNDFFMEKFVPSFLRIFEHLSATNA